MKARKLVAHLLLLLLVCCGLLLTPVYAFETDEHPWDADENGGGGLSGEPGTPGGGDSPALPTDPVIPEDDGTFGLTGFLVGFSGHYTSWWFDWSKLALTSSNAATTSSASVGNVQ